MSVFNFQTISYGLKGLLPRVSVVIHPTIFLSNRTVFFFQTMFGNVLPNVRFGQTFGSVAFGFRFG